MATFTILSTPAKGANTENFIWVHSEHSLSDYILRAILRTPKVFIPTVLYLRLTFSNDSRKYKSKNFSH